MEKLANTPPKQEKNRPQPLPYSPFPEKAAEEKTQKLPHPQISPADGKGGIDPSGPGPQHKQAVPQGCPGKGSEKAVQQSQRASHQAAGKELSGSCRRTHPNSRRFQPPVARGSS